MIKIGRGKDWDRRGFPRILRNFLGSPRISQDRPESLALITRRPIWLMTLNVRLYDSHRPASPAALPPWGIAPVNVGFGRAHHREICGRRALVGVFIAVL